MSSSINAVLGCLQTPLPHPESTAAAQISKCMSSPRDGNSGSPTNHPPVRGEKTRQSQPFPIRPPNPGMFRYGLRIRISHITSHHITSHHITSSVAPLGNPVAAALLACVTVQLQSACLCSAMTELLAAHHGYIRRRWAGRACDREKTQEN